MVLPTDLPPFRAPQQRAGDVVVTAHADAVAVLRETDFHKPPIPWLPVRRSRILLNVFLSLDPPDHTRLRKVVAPHFTPTAIAGHREELGRLAERALDRAPRPFDVVSGFAYPYTFSFACQLMGAREEDWPWLSQRTKILTAALDQPLPLRVSDVVPMLRALAGGRLQPVKVLRCAGSLVRYAEDRIDDTDTPITRALRDAVGSQGITADEATSTWLLLFLAGHETSANVISNAVHALARHPDELARVVADPTLVGSWVEEALRWDPPIPLNARTARVDTRIADREVAAGSAAYLSIRDANRDPNVHPDGDEFRVGRSPEANHLSFGFGTHFCLGAFLARTEVEIGLRHLLERAPDLELAGPPVRRTTVTVSGFESLPLRLDPAPR